MTASFSPPPRDPSPRPNRYAGDTTIAPFFRRIMRRMPLLGQAAPPWRSVTLRHRGLEFRAHSNARYVVLLPKARPVVLPRPWLILMSLN